MWSTTIWWGSWEHKHLLRGWVGWPCNDQQMTTCGEGQKRFRWSWIDMNNSVPLVRFSSPFQSSSVIGKVVNFLLVCKYPQAVPIGLVLKLKKKRLLGWNGQLISQRWTSQSICSFNTVPIKTFQNPLTFNNHLVFSSSFYFSLSFFLPSGRRKRVEHGSKKNNSLLEHEEAITSLARSN